MTKVRVDTRILRSRLTVGRALGLVLGLVLVAPGAHAWADSSFQVNVVAPPTANKQRGVAKIHIAPGAGFHVNKDYPTSVSVVAPTGVTVEKAKQTAKDAVALSETGADFDVAYTASEAGKKTFTGELRFAVCSANSCDPKKEALQFTVDVK
jgi:hypothetical protein